MTTPDEFYVGYEHPMPPRLALALRPVVITLVAAVCLAAVLYATGFTPLPPSRFDFGRPANFEGTLFERPYPTLVAERSGTGAPMRTFLLVAPGKHGAGPLVRGFDGKLVALRGTLAERGDAGLLEVVAGSIREIAGTPGRSAMERHSLGRQTVRGEIVDSKCFLGVMNPGERKVHRDCAVRCILGGIPPALVVRDRAGREALLLIGTPDGGAAGSELASLAGVPVEVTGELSVVGDRLWLHTARAAFRRLAR